MQDLWGQGLAPDFPPDKTIKRVRGPVGRAGDGTASPNAAPPTVLLAAARAKWPDLPVQTLQFPGEPDPKVPPAYRLHELLGEGGMGVVYAARQGSLGREVAVKILRSEVLAEPEAAQRFILEGKLTSRLDHPGILPIHELGQTPQGDLFIAMKRIRGQRWDRTFERKKGSENLQIMLRVCDAVAYAHSRNIIHRDLKPENVIFGEFGEVIVTDWGLAVKVKPGAGGAGIAGEMQAGTPAYMSPEVARGDAAAVGFRSDVYLLGAMLFEIWTGKQPHVGENVFACLEAAAANLIQPAGRDDEIVAIAIKAMATRPADRYASVAEFRQALEEHLQHADSRHLTRSAHEESERAGDDYARWSRVVARFEEAVRLWPENGEARAGMVEAQGRFAEVALSRGDLDLAASLLDVAHPLHQPMVACWRVAQEKRRNRHLRLKIVSIGFMGFALTVLWLVWGMHRRMVTEQQLALAMCEKLSRERYQLLMQLAEPRDALPAPASAAATEPDAGGTVAETPAVDPVARRETGVSRRLAAAGAPSWRAPARRSCGSRGGNRALSPVVGDGTFPALAPICSDGWSGPPGASSGGFVPARVPAP